MWILHHKIYLTIIYDKDEKEILKICSKVQVIGIFVPIDKIPKHIQDVYCYLGDKRFFLDQNGWNRSRGIIEFSCSRAAKVGLVASHTFYANNL